MQQGHTRYELYSAAPRNPISRHLGSILLLIKISRMASFGIINLER
jgi:hypothetical protein